MSDKTAPKPKPTPKIPKSYEVVAVPRAVFEKYWHLPYAEVKAAADAGTDGLEVGQWSMPPWTADVAYVRCGDDFLSLGQTLLFKQCWDA